MITVNNYTGNWQQACRPSIPKVGSYVRIHESADAREYDDFKRHLKLNKLEAEEFIRWMPRLQMNVYKIDKKS
jgi:hypothetical protein